MDRLCVLADLASASLGNRLRPDVHAKPPLRPLTPDGARHGFHITQGARKKGLGSVREPRAPFADALGTFLQGREGGRKLRENGLVLVTTTMARPENRAGFLRTVALVAFVSTLSYTKAFIIPPGTSPWLSVVHAPAFDSEERRPAGGAPALSVRLAAAKKKTTGGGASPPSSKTSPALSVSTSKKKSRKDEVRECQSILLIPRVRRFESSLQSSIFLAQGQAQRHAKHMKKPTDSATCADFGLGGPDFEMELLPPTDKNAGPKTATSRKGVSGSVGTVGGDEDHTTDHHLRLLRQTGKYPVLVLNTDAQPLSYLPLSIIRWQEVRCRGLGGP